MEVQLLNRLVPLKRHQILCIKTSERYVKYISGVNEIVLNTDSNCKIVNFSFKKRICGCSSEEYCFENWFPGIHFSVFNYVDVQRPLQAWSKGAWLLLELWLNLVSSMRCWSYRSEESDSCWIMKDSLQISKENLRVANVTLRGRGMNL